MKKKRTKDNQEYQRILKSYSITGFIHTFISVAIFVLTILDIILDKKPFEITIRVLATITLFNSLLWIILGNIIFSIAPKLKSNRSTSFTRTMLVTSIFLVLIPDIVAFVAFWLPNFANSDFAAVMGLLTPVLVFIGWFIGKNEVKQIQKNT